MTRPSLFLDFGGTLCEAQANILPAFQVAARRAHVQLPWNDYLRANEECWNELWPEAPKLVGKIPAFADRVHEMALRKVGFEGAAGPFVQAVRDVALSPEWHVPYPEAEPTVRQLRSEGISTHIISGHVDYLPLIVRNLGWSDLFDTVTFTQEVGYQKPDVRVFRFALDRAGVHPDEAVYVGDSWELDYLAGMSAGMQSVWLNRARSPAPTPCLQIRDLAEILPLIRAAERPG